MIALGTLVIRTGKGLGYDTRKMRIKGNPAASKLIKVGARKGFQVKDLKV
ncbi:hypothetical protein SCARR_00195 [Pontiella sulfatireligans]|uniref:Uncharacterized protein n=1 Tax=Pontiella sulfatireligans TaxID=2750658 RepID=A0A6C2UFI2_9BACT|nr:hypothetical protein SCARR_00195 [Pontiella sulfatireligans]